MPLINHQPSSSSSRLRSLPPELRLKVFRNLVVHDGPIIFRCEPFSTEANNFDDCCAYLFDSLSALCPAAIGLQLADEVAELFYAENIFWMNEFELHEIIEGSLSRCVTSLTSHGDSAMRHFIRRLSISYTLEADLNYRFEDLDKLTDTRRSLAELLDGVPQLKELELNFWVPLLGLSKLTRTQKGPGAYYQSARPFLPIIQHCREESIRIKTTMSYGYRDVQELEDIGDFFTREIEIVAANLANFSPLAQDYESRYKYYKENLLYHRDSTEGSQKEIIFVSWSDPYLEYSLPEAMKQSVAQLLDTHVVGPLIADEAADYFFANNVFYVSSENDFIYSEGWAAVHQYLRSVIIPISTDQLNTSSKIALGKNLLMSLANCPQLLRLEFRIFKADRMPIVGQKCYNELLPIARLSGEMKAQGKEVRILVHSRSVQKAEGSPRWAEDQGIQDSQYVAGQELLDVSDFVDQPSAEEQAIATTTHGGGYDLDNAAFHRIVIELLWKIQDNRVQLYPLSEDIKDYNCLLSPEISDPRRDKMKEKLRTLLNEGANMEDRLNQLTRDI
ncbi:MAG: hypothetical protein M1812_007044 [Candelaria pacifica]|nr:MAG: hypothetical protein M1812_007044 [Candelaria pacifica]